MSKSILVIETPKNCEECPFFRHRIDCIPEDFCTLDKCKRDIVNPNIKSDWCPLKDIPDARPVKACGEWLDFNCGYNACIDEILKEYD